MKEKIKIIKLIHLAICSGTAMAYLLIGKISVDNLVNLNIELTKSFYIIIPFLAIGLSKFLFKSQLKQIDSKQSLEDNLPIYQTASIIRWAILEGAAFIILFTIPDFLILGIILIVYLIYLRPTEEQIKSELNIFK